MNLPNKLTVSRFVLTVVFLVALFWPWNIPFRNSFALLFFCLAGVTDFLDGRIARARKLITNFGILMDPLADKIMTCSAFIAFVESTRLHPNAPVKVGAWMVIIIVARELAITGLRLLAASKGAVLPAESLGKHKTGWQIATVIFFLLILSAREFDGLGLDSKLLDALQSKAGTPLIGIALGLTLYSGVGYFWRNRQVLTTHQD